MSQFKHTPGPWLIGRHPHNVIGLIAGSEEIVATVGDMPCINGHDDMAAERGAAMERANARLIAAAPDLLAELSHLRRLVGAFLENGGSIPGIATLNGADAAIDKATGESA